LKVAVKISNDELKRLSESSAYSGPTRLDTISEAISSRGASMRSSAADGDSSREVGDAPGGIRKGKKGT